MLALSKGNYTGKVVDNISQNGIIINTVHYALEDENIGLHYHENPHICFLLQGGDKERRKGSSYLRKSGDIFFYSAGEEHASVTRSRFTKSMIIEFENRFLKKYGFDEAQFETAIKTNANIKFSMLKILKELSKHDDCSELTIQMLVMSFCNLSDNQQKKPTPKWVQIIKELLNAKWNQPVTLDELSLATSIHPVTISKYFSKYNHCTLGEYLRKLKIENSIPLIKDSTLSLTEIAYHCGFADQSHFIRVFKDTTGFLPKDFRKV